MADFLLSVGVDVGLSYDQMQKDISDLVTRLNQNPQRVRVGLEIDHSAIERFRTEVANIHNSMGGLGRVTVSPVDTAGLNDAIDGIARMTQHTQGAISAVHTMRAELNSVNTERIQQAIASINGMSPQGAQALAQSLGEANVRATSVRARLLEAADAEQQLVSLQVRGTDAAGNMVNYLMTYNTETGEISRRMVDITTRLEEAENAEARRAVTVRDVTDLYRQMLSLMHANANAANIASYATLADQADLFGRALELARAEAISVDEALNRLGVEGTSSIDAARNAMSAFRLEMEQTGTSGTIDMATMYNTISQMQGLLNSNSGYANLSTYAALQQQVSLFAQAIQLATSGSMTLEAALTSVGLNGSTAVYGAREAMFAFRAEMSGATVEEEKLVVGTEHYQSALTKLNALLRQVRANTGKWTAAKTGKASSDYELYADQARELENLAQRLANSTMTMREFNAEYARIKSTASGAETAIKAAGEATQSWTQRVGKLTEKFGTWFSITRVIMAAYRALRQMVTAVIDVDTAMTELRKVTDETEERYDEFLVNATNRAKQFGATLSDTVSATADFARLGYTIDDAEKLADAAIIYKNVGDGIEDINTASESIIATMQAFGVPAEEAMKIVDKFNEVGNNYAISSKGVGDALLRSAAAMNAANNSLDETIALATAANTIVQDPEKVGTTLKTVSMYLRAAKTEAEEAGESTDGMASSVSELRDEILALTGNKVDIQIDEDNFKSTYQILKELSAVWNELSDVTQANITELVGGKRNSNVVSALLENFAIAEKSLVTSSEAAGSALAENEKYLDSINGKIAQFKATFETFSQNLIGSDLVKLIVDIGTAILKVLDTLQRLNLLLPSIITLAMIIKGIGLSKQLSITTKTIIANKAATESLIASVAKLTVAQKKKLVEDIKAAVASGTLTKEQGAQILTTLGLAAADGTLTIANKGLAASFKSLMASIPVWGRVALGISVVLEGIIALTSAIGNSSDNLETLNTEFEQLKGEIQSISTEYRELVKSADEVIPRFSELAKGVNEFGENVSLTDEEYAEFLQLNNRIAEMFPELNLGMDSNGNAMLALSYSADTLSSSLWDLVEAERAASYQLIADKMPGTLETITKLQKEYNKEIDKLKDAKDEWGDTYEDIINKTLPTNVGRYATQEAGYQATLDFIEKAQALGMHGDVLMDNQQTTNNGYVFSVRWDYENADYDTIKQLYDAKLAEHEKQIHNYENMIAAKWREINPIVSAWLQTDYLFNDLDTQMQSIASAMVSGIDFSSLGLTTEKEVQDYISNHILKPLFLATPEVRDAFEQTIAQLESGDITSEEFEAKMKAAFNDLINGMDSDKVDDFKKMFVSGFNDIGIVGDDFETVCDGIIANWGSVSSAIAGNPVGSTLTDLSKSLTELKTAYSVIDSAQKDMASGNGLSAETVKSLADITDDYINYLYEENGVIKLNIDAWKERSNIEMKNNISIIEGTISALNTERESLISQISALEQKQTLTEDETATLANLRVKLDENTAAIAANQNKLGIYSGLYNDITGSLDAYSSALQHFTDISNAITSVSDSLTTVADLQETVANGFTISLEKALEFAKAYPEILNGATVAADGQIALNENIVNAFIEGKEAELKAEIDAEIAKLESEKAVLTAKMEFSKAQLELAKSVGTGEGQISKEVAEYRVNAGNAVAQALIAAGIDEATAYQLACAAMAQNSEEFNRVAAAVCTDVQGNFNQAAYDAAQAIYTNMQNSKLSIASVAAQAHEAAKAIAGIGSGTVQGSASVNGGGAGGSSGSKGSISVHSGNFKGTEYTYEAKTIALEDFISDLELDISSYQNAISQIDGQIATLKALRNTSLNKFSTSNKKANSGSGGSGSKSDKDDEPTWFETEYALHQHLMKMDAESTEDYLDWLHSAYQRAYEEGIIDLDDYYKYQEEVYEGLKDLFKDYLNDTEHEISMRENYDGEAKAILALYKKMMDDVEKEIAAARARGLDDTDDYIQELQSKWQDYAESRKDIEEGINEDAKDALDELVEYQIDMIKQGIEDEKDALDKKLDYLKDFYDKQKEMLQDQYDEEKYLEEQAEKRKSVSDLQAELAMLENDDSAWAQKRKLELQEELSTAQDELGDFEDEHALNLALDALENSYNAQEAQLQKEMDALDERLNDPEALYNQALAAIKNNTGNLYQEMLEYNRKHGTGNDDDVKDVYEEAYKALYEYKELYGKDYEGVVLTNATGYKPNTGWDDSKISGTNPDNKPKEEEKKPTTTTTTQSTPQLTEAIKKKVAAAIWNGNFGWGTGSTRTNRLKEVFGANNGIQALVNQGVGKNSGAPAQDYTYLNMRKKFKGYASGTKNAVPGLHSIDELGAEYLFTSEDGSRYRVFSGGEKVLNAKATDFLYEFANGGGEILEKIIKSAFGTGLFDAIRPIINNNEVNMGDIIVQGSADTRTVSEIRRAQRDNLTEMLKSLNKLNK